MGEDDQEAPLKIPRQRLAVLANPTADLDEEEREFYEETNLELTNVIFNRFHEIILRDDNDKVERHFVLAMFVGVSPAGEAIAGDDAAAVNWYSLDQLATLPLTGKTELFAHESLKLLAKLRQN